MAKIKIVNLSDLSIASEYEAQAPDQKLYGGPWGDPTQTVHLEVPANMDPEVVEAYVDSNGDVQLREVQALKDAKLQRERDDKLALMRQQRDAKLKEVDVMVNELALGKRTDGSAIDLYRDSLLQITDSYKDANDPNKGTAALDNLLADLSDLNWPLKP